LADEMHPDDLLELRHRLLARKAQPPFTNADYVQMQNKLLSTFELAVPCLKRFSIDAEVKQQVHNVRQLGGDVPVAFLLTTAPWHAMWASTNGEVRLGRNQSTHALEPAEGSAVVTTLAYDRWVGEWVGEYLEKEKRFRDPVAEVVLAVVTTFEKLGLPGL
jgi:hypothetical protein